MNDDDFLKQINKALDQQTDELDAESLSRLNQARQTAIQQTGRQPFRLNWLPTTGLAAAVIMGMLFMFKAEDMNVIQQGDVDEIELIASSDQLELFEQLDFYLWLLDEDADAV